MNRINTETHKTIVAGTPLFASVWMALFNVLRRNFVKSRKFSHTGADNTQSKTDQ